MKVKILERLEEEQSIRDSHIRICRNINIVFIVLLIVSAIIAYGCIKASSNYVWLWLPVAICSAIIIAVCYYSIDATNKLYRTFSGRVYELMEQTKIQKKEKEQLIKQYEEKEHFYKDTIKSKTPFSIVASMYSDWETVAYNDAERYLRYKQNPAPKAADLVSEFRKKARNTIMENKVMEYKYWFLLDAFPELKLYVDDEDSLIHLADYKDYEEFKNEGDEVLEFMDMDEYRRLSITERNQLALDRYKARNKSNWEIGMEYEMYIGYLLRNHNFHTIQYSIENGLSDLGRDIIAERAHLDGSRTIYIIQCKRWSEHRQLHENVVCQLFGTKIEFEIQHQHFMNTTITPVLVTTTDLSETAMEFAKRLGVVVKKVEMGEYPMIKCNVNGDDRIYHLPFDQQYYRTQITNQGEFYAWTVEEAEEAGFRRARRHLV